jgi:cytochrome c oxidase assembly protein subunit 15
MLTALATLGLVGLGGVVTSHEAGMSVPDWPTSYGYNMFALPIRFWKGGIFYEHTHRLWATLVGLLVVLLTRWLGGFESRRPLAFIGGAEVLAGIAVFLFRPELKATGHFLTGIGGVVLMAALIWTRNGSSQPGLCKMGWLAFFLVQLQGLLGGLRVVLFKDHIGILHGTLAQIFFVLLCLIAVRTGGWWEQTGLRMPLVDPVNLRRWAFLVTALIFCQLLLGASMRHQHAGLAIRDFPLAYGKIWPATDSESLARYNSQRVETTVSNPITAFEIRLQMAHRAGALLVLIAVAGFLRSARGQGVFKGVLVLSGLVLLQATLGAATVWTNKAADVATGHVLVGALSLVTGAVLCMILPCETLRSPQSTVVPVESGPAH